MIAFHWFAGQAIEFSAYIARDDPLNIGGYLKSRDCHLCIFEPLVSIRNSFRRCHETWQARFHFGLGWHHMLDYIDWCWKLSEEKSLDIHSHIFIVYTQAFDR